MFSPPSARSRTRPTDRALTLEMSLVAKLGPDGITPWPTPSLELTRWRLPGALAPDLGPLPVTTYEGAIEVTLVACGEPASGASTEGQA